MILYCPCCRSKIKIELKTSVQPKVVRKYNPVINPKSQAMIGKIATVVLDYFNKHYIAYNQKEITLQDLKDDIRDRRIILVRHYLCYLSTVVKDIKAIQVGYFLHKDRTTVYHAVDMIKLLIETGQEDSRHLKPLLIDLEVITPTILKTA